MFSCCFKSMSNAMGEEIDKSPATTAAVSGADNDAMSEESEKVPATASSSSSVGNDDKSANAGCSLRQLRSTYADAFLSRCNKVDPDDFGLPLGTYICPWMPRKLQEEYPEVECRICGKIVEENSSEASCHKPECWLKLCEKLEGQLKEPGRTIWQKMKDCVTCSNEYVNELNEYKEQLEQMNLEYQKLHDYHKNPWKKVTRPKEDLEYFSSRCNINRDLLFFDEDVEVRQRPDFHCSKQFKEQHGNKNLDFGSQCFQGSLLPSDNNAFPGYSPCAIQTTWASEDEAWNSYHSDDWYDYGLRDYSHSRLGLNYTKAAVWMYTQGKTCSWDDGEDGEKQAKEVWRPFTPYFSVPSKGVNPSIIGCKTDSSHLQIQQHGGSQSDVWTTENHDIGPRIKPLLEDLANSTNDCPLPRYQMIIDPNQFVRPRKSDGKMVWVPCEFDIAPDGSGASLVGNHRAHWMDTDLIDSVATPVLTAALPLLAKLTKPYLLLEGQRLQVVVKAQSITVPKKQENDHAPEYVGLWHVDGEHEPVVAVVLYYYDVDEALVGGNMELMDRRPIGVLGVGDASMPREIPREELREALRPSSSEGDGEPLIPNCSVPIKTGKMLVFSNYQMAHRVLRMVNTSQEHPASRKFVALFVMDPAADRLVPARSHLAHAYLYKRALTGKCEVFSSDSTADSLPAAAAELIMEYLGLVPSQRQRRATRNDMLRSQLIPKQSLGATHQMVCSTGNGCVTMLGWIDSLLMDHKRDQIQNDRFYWQSYCEDFEKADKRLNALNYPPNEVGRGLSETLSIPSDDLNFASFYDTLDERNEQLSGDFETTI